MKKAIWIFSIFVILLVGFVAAYADDAFILDNRGGSNTSMTTPMTTQPSGNDVNTAYRNTYTGVATTDTAFNIANTYPNAYGTMNTGTLNTAFNTGTSGATTMPSQWITLNCKFANPNSNGSNMLQCYVVGQNSEAIIAALHNGMTVNTAYVGTSATNYGTTGTATNTAYGSYNSGYGNTGYNTSTGYTTSNTGYNTGTSNSSTGFNTGTSY